MAIPFAFPSQQDAENDLQILDQLFQQLYEIVRQIILRRGRRVDPPPVPAPRNRTNQQRRPVAEARMPQNLAAVDQIVHRDLPLPDLVLSTGFGSSSPQCTAAAAMAAPVPPPRGLAPAAAPAPADRRPQPPPRRPRHRRSGKKEAREESSSESTQSRTWQQIGKELREIADEFKAQHQMEGSTTSNPNNFKKEQSLLSLFVPAPFNGSLWTAVIFLVGWRLLTRRGW